MPETTLIKRFATDLTVNEGERAVIAKINTAVMDRDQEVVLPAGADLSDFEKNPTVFFQHNHQAFPVGKCVSAKRDGEFLITKTVFADRPVAHPANLEWLPDTLLSLYQQKVMNAFSIGMSPTETRPPTKKDMETYGSETRRVISKWKMIEYSCVTIPANQEAVAMAVSKAFAPDEPTPAPAPVVITPKRYMYVLQSAPVDAMCDAAAVKQAAINAIAKHCGRIYSV